MIHIYEISGTELEKLIENCHRLLRAQYRTSPLWALVSDITGHAASFACDICVQCGYNPNQPCGAEKLQHTLEWNEKMNAEWECLLEQHTNT